jgi:predicted ribonuclease YlaK
LDRLYDSSGGEAIYVPDTNALLHNPNLESWAFSETSKFTVILLTTVLSELDLLKVSHRNEEIRKKAETFIRILKEYRRRGKLTTGVTIVKDKIKIQAIALEPNMKVSLPWLDPGNNDDRILAGVIEVMCDRPRSLVMAVSRDINFQNKAEFANIPFVEPPDPL